MEQKTNVRVGHSRFTRSPKFLILINFTVKHCIIDDYQCRGCCQNSCHALSQRNYCQLTIGQIRKNQVATINHAVTNNHHNRDGNQIMRPIEVANEMANWLSPLKSCQLVVLKSACLSSGADKEKKVTISRTSRSFIGRQLLRAQRSGNMKFIICPADTSSRPVEDPKIYSDDDYKSKK